MSTLSLFVLLVIAALWIGAATKAARMARERGRSPWRWGLLGLIGGPAVYLLQFSFSRYSRDGVSFFNAAPCPMCGSVIAKDQSGVRKCGRCSHTWNPSQGPTTSSSE